MSDTFEDRYDDSRAALSEGIDRARKAQAPVQLPNDFTIDDRDWRRPNRMRPAIPGESGVCDAMRDLGFHCWIVMRTVNGQQVWMAWALSEGRDEELRAPGAIHK